MFDLASLDLGSQADSGAKMEVVNPVTGQLVRDADGNTVWIQLLGKHSERADAAVRKITNRRMEAARLGRQKIDADDIESESVELLVACTVGWSFTSMGGEPFEYSETNARRLWSDRKYKPIREQADRFIGDLANFTKG